MQKGAREKGDFEGGEGKGEGGFWGQQGVGGRKRGKS